MLDDKEMIPIQNRIDAIIELGLQLEQKASNFDHETELKSLIIKVQHENPWFTEKYILTALKNWSFTLKAENVKKWIEPYLPELQKRQNGLTVGIVNAGNIPFVGLHDLISVIICGHNYKGKNSTSDTLLLPYILSVLYYIEPLFKDKIQFVHRLESMNAVVATGSNNSARYFEYYFNKYPHIIRKSMNGAGVLTGNETTEDLHNLGRDIFTYFGLGCRNISKLYVPAGYNFDNFFKAIYDFNDEMMMHSKYMNNFDYHNSVFLLKRIPFLQNGFLIIREEKWIASPIAVVHYEEYIDKSRLEESLIKDIDQLQCAATPNDFSFSQEVLKSIQVDFGKTQSPDLWDYADRVDTMKFLCSLKVESL